MKERITHATIGLLLGIIIGMAMAPAFAQADPNDSLERSAVKAADELSEISETLKKIDRKMK